MTSERQAKIAKFRKRIERERQATLNKALIEATEKLAAATETIANFSVEAPVVNNTIDTTELVEAVKGIKIDVPAPVVKVNVPQQMAPVVNVSVDNPDIYARYKRVNSSMDPEGTYHGFVDTDGNWFIQLESTMNAGNTDITRYATGMGEFNKAWVGRKRLSYKPFNKVDVA